jgi:peptide/nickel transport system substrate-binding protein
VKKRIIWLAVSLLMALSLVIASCGQAAVEEKEEEEEEEGQVVITKEEVEEEEEGEVIQPSTEGPSYGGTFAKAYGMDITGFDEIYGFHANPTTTIHLTNEELLTGDWARGKAGTGELAWDMGGNDIWEYKKGSLAESWDFSEPGVLVFHIRQGVHWALNPDTEASQLVNGRELTADDVVFTLTMYRDNLRSYIHMQPGLSTVEISALDKYTVVIKVDPAYVPAARMRYADFASIVPREVVEKYGDMNDWRRSVGTGPFMLVDHVPGSLLTFKRNPDYWDTDPVGPGKGNQLPYLETVKYMIIPDSSTIQAAFRTGRIDVGAATWETFPDFWEQTDGKIKYSTSIFDGGFNTHFDIKNPPFSDVKCRRAMMMAIDWKALAEDLFGGEGVEINTWPVTYNSAYKALFLSLDDPECPASVKELYTYNPEKAQQLLTEAGYPNGFKVKVLCQSTSAQIDYFSVLLDDFAKVGVELEIEPLETGAWTNLYQGKKWYGTYQLCYSSMGGLSTALMLTNFWGKGWANATDVTDPYIGEKYDEIQETLVDEGQAAAMAIHKELMKYVLDQAWAIPYPKAPGYNMWWPWLQNYHGEFSIGNWNEGNWVKWVWIDEALKKSMGY